MSDQLMWKEKHRLLKEVLRKSLKKKHSIELKIDAQFAELKKSGLSLEKVRVTR
jgi:hypothetical protein